MSYDNAEPKVLKTLNSSGQVLDDAGNVISDTTSYWEKKYIEAEPKPDKILKSDGSVVDSNGNQIQATNEYNVKKYNQAEPIPAKYLHSDGTIDENPGGGGGADLEDNHQTTIDVSTYTEPVEVLPTSGKDGMKKATITLSNIPSPSGSVTLYAWVAHDTLYVYTYSAIPRVGDTVIRADDGLDESQIYITENGVASVEEDMIRVGTMTYTRDSTADITINSDGSVIPLDRRFAECEDDNGHGETVLVEKPVTVGNTAWDYNNKAIYNITSVNAQAGVFATDGGEGSYYLPLS